MSNLGDIGISASLDLSAIDKDINNLGSRYKNTSIKIPVELPNLDKEIKQLQSQIPAFDFAINLKVDQQQVLRIRSQLQRQIAIPISVQHNTSVQKVKADIDAKAFDGIGDRVARSITNSFDKVGDNLSESLGKSIKKALPSKGIFSGIFEGIGNTITAPIKAIGRGIFEGIGQPIGKELGSGIKSGIDQITGEVIGDSQLLGEKIAISLGEGIKEILPEVLGNKLSKQINNLLEDTLGIDNILIRSRSKQASKQKELVKQKEEASPLLRREYMQSTSLKARGKELEQELNVLKPAYEEQLRDFQKRFNEEAEQLKNRSLLINIDVSPEQIAESINRGLKAAGQSRRVSAEEITPQQVMAQSKAATSRARNEYVTLGLHSQFALEKAALNKQFQELSQKTSEFNQIIGKLSHGIAALQAAGGLKQNQQPKIQHPEIYRQLASEVAKASGLQIQSNKLPQLVPSSDIREGATGHYLPEKNVINVSEKTYQNLLSENVDFKTIEVIVHELRHALQFNFGANDARNTRTSAVDLIQPTPQEIKKLGRKIEFSTSSQPESLQGLSRKLEADAYVFAERNTKQIFQSLLKQSSISRFEQSAGIGGSKIDTVIKQSQKEALSKIFKIKELANEYGVDLSQEIDETVKEFESISGKLEPLFEKARSIDLLPQEDIQTLFADLQKEAESAISFTSQQVDNLKKALINKKAAASKQQNPEPVKQEIEPPEIYKTIFSKVAGFSGLKSGNIPKLEAVSGELQEFFKKTGTIAAYLSKINKIALNPQTVKAMQSGQPLSYEAVGSAVHEMRHAAQLGFGQISNQDLAKGKIAVDLLIPTPEELEIFKDELEKSVASAKISMPEVPEEIIRAIEADAYLFEMLYGQSIFDAINETSKTIQKAFTGNEVSKVNNDLEQNIKARLMQMQPKLIREIAKNFNVQVSSSNKGYLPKNDLISNLVKKVDLKELDFHVPSVNKPSDELIEYAKQLASLPVQEAEETVKQVYAELSSALKEVAKPGAADVDIKSLMGLLNDIEEAHQLVVLMMGDADKELFNKLRAFRANLVKLKQQGTLTRLNAEFQQAPSKVASSTPQTVEQMARVGGVLSATGVVGNKLPSLNEVQKRFDRLYSKAQKELENFNKVFDSIVPPVQKPGVLNALKYNLDLAYRKGATFLETFKINLTVSLDKLLENLSKYSKQIKFIENLPSLPVRIGKATVAERGVKLSQSANTLSDLAFNYAQSAQESERPKKLNIASNLTRELGDLEAFIATKDFKGIAKVTAKIEKGFKELGISSQELSTIIGHNESQIKASVRAVSGVFGKLDENIQTLTGKSLSDLGKTALHAVKAFLAFQTLNWIQNWLQSVGAQTLELATKFQVLQRTISFISGGPIKGADTMKFLKSEVDRVSGNFMAAIEGYKSIAASARGTRLEGEPTREIFSAVNQASAVYGLTNEQTSGALLAVSQMISKGVISAEELRGQLSERIPGALQIMARALGVTEAQLGKLLESGSLTASEVLPKFAKQMAMETAGGVAGAANTAQGSINKLNNTIQQIQIAVGSAAIPAQVISFNLLANVLEFVADNADAIVPVITALSLVLGGQFVASLFVATKGFLAMKLGIDLAKGSLVGFAATAGKSLLMLGIQTIAIAAVLKGVEAAWGMAGVAIGKNDLSEWADRTEKNVERVRGAMDRLRNKTGNNNTPPDKLEDTAPSAGWWDIVGNKQNDRKSSESDRGVWKGIASWGDVLRRKRREAAAEQSISTLELSNAASELISGFSGGKSLEEAIKASKKGTFHGSGALVDIAKADAEIAKKQIEKQAVLKTEGEGSERAKQIQSEIDSLTEKRAKAAKEVTEVRSQLSQQIQELKEKIKNESDPQIKAGMESDLQSLEKFQSQLQRIETQAGTSSADAIIRFTETMRELSIAISESAGKAQEWLSIQNAMAARGAVQGFSKDRLAGRNLQAKQLENQRDALKQQIKDQEEAAKTLQGLLGDTNNQSLLKAAGVNQSMTPERLKAVAETTKDAAQKKAIESLAQAKELNRDKLRNEEQLAQTELQIKQQAEQTAIAEIQRSAAIAQSATKKSENARVAEIQKAGTNRKLTEEKVAEEIASIQLDAKKQSLEALNLEESQLDKYYAKGMISAEQYDERKRELANRFSDEQKALSDAEIAATEATNKRKLADYEFTTKKREALLEASFTKEANRIKSLQANGKISSRQAEKLVNTAQSENLQQQKSETQTQINDTYTQESSKTISPRQAEEKRLQLKQKLNQIDQQIADNQIQANEQALRGLDLANQRAEASIEISQQKRINIIKAAQAKGMLSDRQAQQKLNEIQSQTLAKQVSETQRLIAQNRNSVNKGLLSPEEGKTKEIELQRKLAQQQQQLSENIIQKKQGEIQRLEMLDQRRLSQVELNEQRRISLIKAAQAKGELSDRQVQEKIVNIQSQTLAKQVGETQRKIAQNRSSVNKGLLSPEEGKTKEIELQKQLAQQQQQLSENIIQKKQNEIQRLEMLDQRRLSQVELNEQHRINLIKAAQAKGDLSDGEAQQAITAAQSRTIADRITLTKKQIEQEKLLAQTGKRSREESVTRQIDLQKQLGQQIQQQIENELQALNNLRESLNKTVEMREAQNNLVSAKAQVSLATREASTVERIGKISPLQELQFERENLLAERERIERQKQLLQTKLGQLPQRRLSGQDEQLEKLRLQEQILQSEADFQRNRKSLASNAFQSREKLSELGIGEGAANSALEVARRYAALSKKEADITEASGGVSGGDPLTKIALEREKLQAQQNKIMSDLTLNRQKQRDLANPGSKEEEVQRLELLREEADITAQLHENRKALAENVAQRRDKLAEIELAKSELQASERQLDVASRELTVLRSGLPFNQEQFRLQTENNRLLAERQTLLEKQRSAQEKVDSLRPGASEEIKLKLTKELNDAIVASYQNEKSLIENNRQIAINAVEQRISAEKRLSDQRVAGLEKEKQALEINSKLLDISKQLIDSRANLQKAISDADTVQIESRLNVADRAVEAARRLKEDENLSPEVRTALQSRLSSAGLSSSATEADALINKQKIENELAQQKIAARLQEEEIARRQLEIEIQRNQLAAEMQVAEGNITVLKAQQAELDAKLNLQKAASVGDSEAIANAQAQLDLASQSVGFAEMGLDIAQQNLDAQKEMADNEQRRLSIQQQSAAAQSKAAESARLQDQALTKAEARAKGIASASNKSSSDSGGSSGGGSGMGLTLVGDSIAAFSEASQKFRSDLANGGKLNILQQLMGGMQNPFYQYTAENSGMRELARLAESLKGIGNSTVQSTISEAKLRGQDVLEALKQLAGQMVGATENLGNNIDRLANRPVVNSLSISSPNPVADSSNVINSLAANSVRYG